MEQLAVTEFKNIRVLTTQQLAESYETNEKVISNNFNRNKDRYEEGKHYILLQGESLREFKTNHQIDESLIRVNQLYMWTEKGAFLHAKSLNTDKAWEVYDKLVDTYFKVKKLSALEQLQLQNQALLEVNDKVDEVKNDLEEFKQEMPLLGCDMDRITTAIRTKGIKCLGGKNTPAYKDKPLRSRVYSDIHMQLRREFGVSTYKSIKRNQVDKAVDIVNKYYLPYVLAVDIADANTKMAIA
nr:MAG TPA: hypothetical protein [Bacteriophage sp.]